MKRKYYISTLCPLLSTTYFFPNKNEKGRDEAEGKREGEDVFEGDSFFLSISESCAPQWGFGRELAHVLSDLMRINRYSVNPRSR